MRVSCGNIYVDLTWSKGSTTINYSGTPGSQGNYWRIKTAGSSGWNGYKAANGVDSYGNSSGSGTFTQSSQSQNYVLQWYNGGWSGTYQESFTISTSTASDGSGGGSTTPSYDYKSNTISFSQTSYNLPSYGGTINYTRSTTGTGKAPVLWINSEEIATLGKNITSSNGTVNESFETSDYSSYFNTGNNTVELKVAAHTSGNTITSAASTNTTINIGTKPNPPTIKQTIVSSSIDKSYVTADKITSESGTTIYCSLDGETEWFQYLAGTYSFETNEIYYFKSSNGIEDSDIVDEAPVVSNSVAPISITKVTYTQLKSSSLLSNATYARKVKPIATANFVEYKWYFRTSTTGTFSASSPYYLITSSSQNSAELTINDPTLKMGYYYQIGVSGTDNYGDTSQITWWTSQTFQIAPVPKITTVLNYFMGDETFDSALADSNRFYTNLTFSFQYNEEITNNNLAIQYKKASASSWSSAIPKESNISLGNISTNGTVKISLPSNLDSDKEYEFRIRYTLYGSEVFSNTIRKMYQVIKKDIIKNLTIYGNQETFKPYTETGTLELRFAKPYENSFKENYTSYENFQCQIIINKKTILLDMLENNGFKENSNSTVSFFFNKSNLYDKLKTLNLDQTLSYKATLKLAVDNVFGLSSSDNLEITIDYKEKPTIVFNQPKYNNGTLLNSNSIIKENDKITFSFSFSDYNDETFRSCIQINRSDSSTPDGQWIDYDQEVIHSQSGRESGYLTPIEYKNTRTITIKEITLPKYIFFRVRVTDSSGNMYSGYYDCGRSLQHTTPIIQQLNVTYKEEGNTTRAANSIITGQLSLIDLGIGLKEVPSLDLIDIKNSSFNFYATFQSDGSGMTEISGSSYSFNELIEKYQQNKNLTFTIPFNFDGIDVNYATLQIRARTKISYSANNLSSDKTFNLSPFIVFNTLQTISYRKNRLAINVRDFDTNPDYEDAILVIGQANSSKNKIIYSAPNGSGYLINFIIDCGTW